MRSYLRSLGAILLGLVSGFFTILVVELVNARIFPLPYGVNPSDPAAYNAAMAAMPETALVMVLVGWALGTFVAAWVAARLTRRSKILHGMVVGVILLAGAIADMLGTPHPFWFWIFGAFLFLPAAYFGASVAKRHDGESARTMRRSSHG